MAETTNLNCYNCKEEIGEKQVRWIHITDKAQICACSDGCYMFSRLTLEHPYTEGFMAELKRYHPRWIKAMQPFLSQEELDSLKEKPKEEKPEIIVVLKKKWYQFWK